MDKESKKPEMVLRVNDVKVVVWSNEITKDGKEEVRKSFILEKIYKDKDDNWKSTSSFNLQDIDKLIYVLNSFKSKVFPVHVDNNNN